MFHAWYHRSLVQWYPLVPCSNCSNCTALSHQTHLLCTKPYQTAVIACAAQARTALVRCLKAFTPWTAAATRPCLHCAGKRPLPRFALCTARSHARRAASLLGRKRNIQQQTDTADAAAFPGCLPRIREICFDIAPFPLS